MTDYTKLTDFAAKDSLLSGNPAKVVRGSEIDAEFTNIAVAVATKTDDASAAITGGTINGTPIGATTPSTGAFTTLSATGDLTLQTAGTRVTGATTTGNSGVQNNNGSAYLLNFGSAHATEASNVWINSTGGSVKIKNATSDVGVFSSTGLAVTGALSATGVGSVGGAAASLTALTVNQSSTYAETVTNGSQTYSWRIDGASYKLSDRTAFTEKLEVSSTGLAVTGALSATGNVGVGVTPSAWDAAYRAADVGYATLHGGASNGAVGGVGSNYYIDAGGYKYKQSAQEAQALEWNNGAFTFKTAGTGTAGNAITFTQSLAVGNGTTLALEGATSAAGTGIAFPATQLASSDANTLDDYEEGTFTPAIAGGTTSGVGTYTTQVGRYTKIGNRVTFHITVTWTAHTGTGALWVTALPFTTSSASGNYVFNAIGSSTLTFTGQLVSYIEPGGTRLNVGVIATGAGLSALAMDTAATLYVSGSYEV